MLYHVIFFCAKQTCESLSNNLNIVPTKFSLIHRDVWGPYNDETHNRARYFLTILDDYSRVIWVFLMTNKNEVKTILPRFFNHVITQFDTTIKQIRIENGGEFLCLKDFFLIMVLFIKLPSLIPLNKMVVSNENIGIL